MPTRTPVIVLPARVAMAASRHCALDDFAAAVWNGNQYAALEASGN